MSANDSRAYLLPIRDSLANIGGYTHGGRDAFFTSAMIRCAVDGDTPAARLERCAPWHRVIGRGCGCPDQEPALTEAHSSATGSPPITSVK
jgi:hypothetical protein